MDFTICLIFDYGSGVFPGPSCWPEIPFKVKQMDFSDKWAAIVWMCRNQLGRRNLTEEQTAYIIKQEYEAQQKTSGGTGANQYTKKEQLDPLGQAAKTDTRSSVARAHGVSEHFVQNSVAFGRGLDAAEEVLPGPYLLGAYRPERESCFAPPYVNPFLCFSVVEGFTRSREGTAYPPGGGVALPPKIGAISVPFIGLSLPLLLPLPLPPPGFTVFYNSFK